MLHKKEKGRNDFTFTYHYENTEVESCNLIIIVNINYKLYDSIVPRSIELFSTVTENALYIYCHLHGQN